MLDNPDVKDKGKQWTVTINDNGCQRTTIDNSTMETGGILSDNGGNPHFNYLTTESFMEIIKSPEYTNVITAAIEPIVSRLEKRIENLESKLEKTNKVVRNQALEINKLKKDVLALTETSDNLQKDVYTHKRNERLKNLRVAGIKGSENDIKTSFIALAREKLEVDLQDDELSVRKTGKDTAPAQLLFTNIWKRNMCFQKKTKLRGTDTYLSEDLTPEDAKVFYEARKLRKEGKIAATWTNRNAVFVKTVETSIPMAVTNLDNLKKLVQPERGSNLSFYDARDSEDDTSFNGFTAMDITEAEDKNRLILKKVEELLKTS